MPERSTVDLEQQIAPVLLQRLSQDRREISRGLQADTISLRYDPEAVLKGSTEKVMQREFFPHGFRPL